tara:strand:- start:105 stop:308 length:204 start_codon:yes stop_codon:yes gene_type:complete
MAATYRVSGMSCEGCANSVTNAVKSLAPEATVVVDLAAKAVSVDGFDDSRAIGQAIEDAGFEFGGVA